ncbi:hypothetical protein [Halomontanus rarus]|nr:hypothetical protein [Halovivax sp. TS33]
MCHCFEDVSELTADERAEIVESHTRAELEAELDEDDLSTLGLPA